MALCWAGASRASSTWRRRSSIFTVTPRLGFALIRRIGPVVTWVEGRDVGKPAIPPPRAGRCPPTPLWRISGVDERPSGGRAGRRDLENDGLPPRPGGGVQLLDDVSTRMLMHFVDCGKMYGSARPSWMRPQGMGIIGYRRNACQSSRPKHREQRTGQPAPSLSITALWLSFAQARMDILSTAAWSVSAASGRTSKWFD